MTIHDDDDAALDALLDAADDGLRAAVAASLDADAGRAAIFTRALPPHRDALPPADNMFGGHTTIHWADAIDTDPHVSRILELLSEALNRLSELGCWLRTPGGPGTPPGRTETAATLLTALWLGVKERGVDQPTAQTFVGVGLDEIRELRNELRRSVGSGRQLRPDPWDSWDGQWADAHCHRLHTTLQTARNLLPDLFRDGSETSSVPLSSR
ncbi:MULTISPECIES: hypothetical protein [Streptomyces]|uniref:Uncharacterized protein n=3 Tax=Streptomyces TaxID=1883 RepID=I2MTW9_STRT9|nr:MULTISPECIES: hypothetical protein [Streptomyces]ADU56340.1 putative oxidoreductase [Streptomyces sp. KCTC 11604BP]ADX99506.1 cytochrome P450 [Streptomyces sp. MJM7001]AZK92743.1 hypothetical protein B7R87_01650 [Streptomyces tsukubensis]EIF88216.1 hypothetical protein [Streptomyces tsukubensis NRRL18488]MYS65498.1 hypothetical protein [Streptomyces sp. SID5473]